MWDNPLLLGVDAPKASDRTAFASEVSEARIPSPLWRGFCLLFENQITDSIKKFIDETCNVTSRES